MEPHFDDRPFTTKGNIKQDMHTHTDEKTFRCVHCSKCLAATASLKRDTCTCMLVPISPRHLECNECNKCFEHMSDFKKHLETSSDVDEDNAGFVRCKVCSKSFPRSDCLKHLMLIHSDDKTVQCDVCFNFKKHVDTHFDDGPLECTVCNKSFSRRECLKHHMLNHSDDRRFRCEVCSKDFTRSFDLEMHLLIHSGKKPFRCGMCLKKFQSKEGIEQHMLIHTGVKSFKCEECGKCFARSDNLKQHMLSHTFKCEECGKCFARSDNLKQHMLSHTFKCEECGKCFARRDNLEQHMLCHTAAEKHFKCGVCHKSFSESRGLKTHMLDHTADQKYVRPGRPCPFCDFFSQNSKLSRHISLKHGDILEVKNALQMPRTARLQAFDHFKKRSIFLTNKMLLANSNNEILMTEKKSGSSQTVVCQRCKGFYAKRSFYKHKKRCRSKAIVDNTAVESGPVPVEMLASCEEDEDFTVNVLSKFYQDPVGNVCKSNSMIKKIGLHLWQKSKKDREKRSLVRKSVTRDMRILGLLFLEFRKQTTHGEGEDATFSDMFKREYLDYLKQAIESLIYSKPNGGLVKSALMYLINTAGQIIQADFFIQNMDEEASEVDKFLKIYHVKRCDIFGD